MEIKMMNNLKQKLGKSILSAILYTSYNSITLIPIIVLLATNIKNKRENKIITLVSAVIFFVLIIAIYQMLTLSAVNISKVEIPVLTILDECHPIEKMIYSVAIITAILTSAISSGYGVAENIKDRRKYKTIMNSSVYVDSPLAISATEVFKENTDLFDDDIKQEILRGDNPLEFPNLKFTRTADESKALNEDPTPSIIISASGMCEVGRIKHHLKHNLWNPKSTILFVGYQAPGTLGYSIVNGAKKVKIFGEEIAVNARIEYIEGYSGHADQEGLMDFVYSFIKKPKKIFLVHGEEESQEVLEQKIETEAKLPVIIPNYGETYELEQENVQLTHKLTRQLPVDMKSEVLKRLEKLKAEIQDMDTSVKEDMNNKELRDEDVYRINEKIKDLEKQILNVIEG